MKPLSWEELQARNDFNFDRVNGPTNPQSRLRLFGHSESEVPVKLYRDHHAWCPYFDTPPPIRRGILHSATALALAGLVQLE